MLDTEQAECAGLYPGVDLWKQADARAFVKNCRICPLQQECFEVGAQLWKEDHRNRGLWGGVFYGQSRRGYKPHDWREPGSEAR